MKIRNGFVSNSSSSSFVVLLPENFIQNIDFDKITDGDEDFPLDDFKRMLNDLIQNNGMWMEEVGEYTNNSDYYFIDHLDDLIRPYIVADLEAGSDQGQIKVLNREKIKKLL